VLALGVTSAAPAGAKGVESVTIDGPGVARPVVLRASGDPDGGGGGGGGGDGLALVDDAGEPVPLVRQLRPEVLTGDAAPDVAPEPPTGDLGPAYTAVWVWYGFDRPIDQVLYPFAAGGPVAHVPAGSAMGRMAPDRWFRLPDATLAELADLHVIARSGDGFAPRPAVSGEGAAEASGQPSASPADGSDGAGAGLGRPWVVGGVVAAIAVVGGLAVVARPSSSPPTSSTSPTSPTSPTPASPPRWRRRLVPGVLVRRS
ncbi:MAG TPA: hypothetical protein VF743_09285, partial [Acidimicrobiales bacterium]